MSGYYNDMDEAQRRRAHRGAQPMYDEREEFVSKRGGGAPNRHTDLVRRPDSDSGSSADNMPRGPPSDADYVKRRTRRREYKSGGNGGNRRRAKSDYSDSSSDDSYYDRRGHGGGGHGSGRRTGRRDRDAGHRRYDSESDSDSNSPPRRKGERRKSIVEQALAAAGIGGGAAAAIQSLTSGGKAPDKQRRARSRSRASRPGGSRSRSQSRSNMDMRAKMMQAGKAAAMAGVAEAVRSRKEPGGVDIKRIATAAFGAAGIDGLLDRDSNKSGTSQMIQSALGGIMSNRLVNGARGSESRSRSRGAGGGGDRRRSKSSGPGIGAIASAAGVAALGAKAYSNYKKSRSRDQSPDQGQPQPRGRNRGMSPSGSDSGSGGARSPRGRDGGDKPKGLAGQLRARSRSVKRFVNQGLVKLHIDDPRETARLNGYDDDDHRYPGGQMAKINDKGEDEKHGTSTDSYSSSDELKKQRKMRTKEMLTAGLATVATVHAAHSIYSGIQNRKERREEVKDGTMEPETAKRLRNRARVKDAVAVGIAAIGIKHAYGEWREMQEQRHEFHEKTKRLEEMREHRRLKHSPDNGGNGNGNGPASTAGSSGPYYNQGGNPYASSVPPPPMGQAPRY